MRKEPDTAPQKGATDVTTSGVRTPPLVLPTTNEPEVIPSSSVAGTGEAVAARPSTVELPPVPERTEGEQGEDDDEPPQQRCHAAELTLTGCARKHTAGIACRETSLGKYFLLEDDVLPKREAARSDFFLRATRRRIYHDHSKLEM